MSEVQTQTIVKIALMADALRSDLEQGLVWFVNYAAIDPKAVKVEDLDLHGAAMLPGDVETFAHRWLAYSRSVDINHDGIGRPVQVIESFFNSEDVASPSWPLNSHATRLDVSGSDEAMGGLRDGSLNCVSLDAYTFNKVQRLPVADAMKALQVSHTIPGDSKAWASELARAGFPGVTGIKGIAPGLFLAERTIGMPIAVHVKNGDVEMTAAGGAWGHVAAAVLSSASLVLSEERLFASFKQTTLPGGFVPAHGSPTFEIDWAPWDMNEFNSLLQEHGIMQGLGMNATLPGFIPARQEGTAPNFEGSDKSGQVVSTLSAPGDSPWAFVAEDGTGMLPHHTVRAGEPMVSKAGIMDALDRISVVPEPHRAEVKAHLMTHLDAIRDATGNPALMVGEVPA